MLELGPVFVVLGSGFWASEVFSLKVRGFGALAPQVRLGAALFGVIRESYGKASACSSCRSFTHEGTLAHIAAERNSWHQ